MLNRRTLMTVGMALLARPAFASKSAFTDLFTTFWPAYLGSRTANDRVDRLLSGFFERYRDIYSAAGLKLTSDKVAKWLKEFDGMADPVHALWQKFPHAFGVHTAHFEERLPDFKPDSAPIYVMPSLFGFDAHLQPSNGVVPLFIGLDGIVKYHGKDPDLSVLLDHESFHLYQAQAYPAQSLEDPAPVFVNLWIEGCATYVSALFNPRAPLLNILLDDKPLADASEQAVRAAISDLLSRLDSRTHEDINRFFGAGYVGDYPARMGYLIGLNLARRLGVGMTPQQMARIPNEKLRVLIRQGLEEMNK